MSTTSTTPKKTSPLKQAIGLILAFVLPFVGIGLINEFLLRNYNVPSASMETTLMTGDRIVGTVTYDNWKPTRGEIVVFEDSQGWLTSSNYQDEQYLVKRIIGLPGDTIECCTENNEILINGEPYKEDYVIQGSNISFPPQVVPEGHVFVMGDNRANSADSRYHLSDGKQFIPIKDVVSSVKFRYWPLTQISAVH